MKSEILLIALATLLFIACPAAAGEVIGPTRLDASAGESAPDEFIGLCRVPEQPFRVRVRGLDQEGHLVQRITTALIMPE